MFDQHNHYAHKENATFEQRAIAFVIDTTILGLLISFLESTIGYFQFLGFLYYVFSQLYLGYSPGKFITGLRVISTTGKSSVIKMLVRETFGKFCSMSFFGTGFLAVMFRSDRVAFHDNMSSTRVITLTPQNVSGLSQLARGMASLLLIFAMLSGYVYYNIFYSDFIIKKMASTMEEKGYQVKGPSGSISRGFTIKQISKKDDGSSIELNNITFKINGDLVSLKKLTTLKELIVIDYVQVGSGFFKAEGEDIPLESMGVAAIVGSLGALAESKKKEVIEKKPFVDIDRDTQENSLKRIQLKSLEVSDFKLQYNDYSVDMDRIAVGNLLNEKGQETWMEYFYLSSNIGAFYFKDVHYNKAADLQSYRFDGTIKKDNVFFSFLNTDINLSGKYHKAGKDVELDLEAFNKSILISKKVDSFLLHLDNLNLNKFFKKKTPISIVNLYYQNMHISGDMKVRNKLVRFNKTNVLFLLKGFLEGYVERYGSVALKPSNLTSKKPWLLIKDGRGNYKRMSSYDLAELYTKEPFDMLSIKNKKAVQKDSRFFSKGPFYDFMKSLKEKQINTRSPASRKVEN